MGYILEAAFSFSMSDLFPKANYEYDSNNRAYMVSNVF